jgi:hypothetical protein
MHDVRKNQNINPAKINGKSELEFFFLFSFIFRELTSQSDVSENSDLFPNLSSTDSIENDVRLCLDDILYDIIVRTIVK